MNPKVVGAPHTTPEEKKTFETLSEFETRISHAKMNGDEWLETSPEIVKYFNRNGLQGAKFFHYKDIKVCEYGTKDKIMAEQSEQMDKRLHGDGEATWVSGPAH